MPKATVQPTCGLITTIEARQQGMQEVLITVESECANVRRLAEAVPVVDPFREMSFRGEGPTILAMGHKHCAHTSCPVPVAMIKVVEIAAGMDLPKEVKIDIVEDE